MKHILLLTAISLVMALSNSAWADTGYVTVGTGTSSSSIYPYGTSDKYSTTQSIYTANEIGTSGTIRTIAYKVASSGNLSTTSVNIYMGHTSKSSFSSPSDYLNVSNMTLVYSGSPTLATQTGWEKLTLSTPFAYNGTDNLVIVVGRQSNSYDVFAKYYYSTTSSSQCLYRSTNTSSSYGNPSTTGGYSTSSSRANVWLGFDAKEIGQFSYIFTPDTTATVCGTTATGAVTIPSSVAIDDKNYTVTAIDAEAFRNKIDITSVTIPASVTSIGNDAFTGCSSIKEVKIEDGTTVLSLGYKSNSSNSSYYYGLFEDCPIETLYLGRNLGYWTHGYNSSYPGYGAPFEFQSNMQSVTIGGNVTSIGDYAFYGCSGKLIVNCNIAGASSGGWSYGSKFSSVEIGKDVTKIGSYAFYNCSSLTSITIPASVTSIGNSAFEGCTSLANIDIPSSVTSIGYSAFKGCTGKLIVNCNIGNVSSSSDGWFNGSKFSSVEISKDVTSIGNYAFYGSSNIKSLTIGSGVTTIGSNAFYYSPTKTIWLTNTPPSGYSRAEGKVNYVSNNNFTSLNNTKEYAYLSSMFEDKGIKYVPVNPSERTCDAIDCTYLPEDSILNIGKTVSYRNIDMTIQHLNDYLCYGDGHIKKVTISADAPVGDYAFYNCSALSSVTLGEQVSAIGSYVFYNCEKIEEIAIPDATTSLGTSCFSGCKALTTITLGEGVKTIDPYAFQNCQALEDIAIPSNVTKIDDYAFSGCKKLADVVIADRNEALTLGYNGSSKPLFSDCPLDSLYIGGKISYNTSSSYGYSPFYRNTSLRTVVITNEETEIYANEFYGCSNLQNVKIGDGVKKIGNYAFSGCSSLEAFGFGSGTQSIGLEAFSDCTALTSIATKATNPPACGTQALDDINKWDCTLYVPEASVSAYQAADQWKDFFFVSTIEGSNIGDNDEFEGVHRFIRDGERFQNTLARDYDTVTYVRNFECYDWEAVYLPFSMSYDDWKEDFDVARINAFYQYDDDDNGTIDRSVLQAIKVKSGELRHNFPYLIRAKVPGAKSIDLLNTTVHTSKVTSVDCSTVSTQFTFVGTYNTLSGANFSGKNVYTLENGQFAPIAANGTVPSCRWYIEVEARTIDAPAMNAHSIHINVFEDEDEMETAIEEISEKKASAPIYSVEGFRVDENRMNRGVFMQNGRKFIRR